MGGRAPRVRRRGILDRLATKSIDDYDNPYRLFEWPEQLPEDMWWMSPELTTTYGTEWAEKLTPEQLHTLSKHESINFYSLNVHGIRELLVEVVNRIHTAGFETPSEFFHHFIGEENEHMWFFAEFCLRYGKKIYRQPAGGAETAAPSDKVQSLLVFARILIFEELVDHFNSAMAEDERLHETIRGINRIHHQDESRHIAFGRELVNLLHQDLKKPDRHRAGAGRGLHVPPPLHAAQLRIPLPPPGLPRRRHRAPARAAPGPAGLARPRRGRAPHLP
ncbi:hypothetical protein SCYAM73S_07667 [Streptomyces cyaneofuscatus]